MAAQIRLCDLYVQTVKAHPEAAAGIAKFIAAKSADPLQSYGGSDTHFVGEGPIGRLGLKIKHAHISQDLSIVYRVHGKPTTVDIYGVFSHKELGTGNAPNVKLQKAMGKKFTNQEFK